MKSKNTLVAPVFLVIIGLGLLFSYLGFLISADTEKNKLALEFERQVDSYIAAIEQEVSVHAEIMQNLTGLFLASTHVDREEFKTFTQPIVQRHDTIQALEWAPKVSQNQRRHFETLARTDGLASFSFTERNQRDAMVSAADRLEYFPVYYVEPLLSNETALGFDLASNPIRRQTLNQSRDSGKILTTAPITLVQEKEQQKGVLIFAPVIQGSTNSPGQRRAALQGFVVGVFDISDMLDKAVHHAKQFNPDISIKIFDTTNPDKPEELYQTSQTATIPLAEKFKQQRFIHEGGRVWQLTATPQPAFLSKLAWWPSFLILIAGITLTLLIAFYVYMLMNREKSIRNLEKLRSHELESSKYRTQVILDTALNAIITINNEGLIQTFNPAAEKLFGYKLDEVIGNNIKMLMPAPYREEHDGYISSYKATREAKIIGIGREVKGQRKDGTTFPLFLSVSEAELNGDSIFVGVIIDLTLQKESERVLVEAKENAERMNRSKSEFLNMMSHELRTPLTVILGYLPLLKEQDTLPEPEVIADIANDMDAAGRHLLELINDLLDISKIEAGKLDLAKAHLSTAVVVTEAINALTHLAAKKHIELISKVEDIDLFADPVRIKQIFINLIGNAIKFTTEGCVTVAAKRLENSIEFSVTDTGCGIEADALSTVFDKFHQVDSSSTRMAGGTGLGLAITKKLVELHDGEISVTSELNQGSTFTFTINNEVGTT